MLLFGVAGAASTAILLPGLALVRDTTGHDWYAAGKLVVIEAMIAVGFDPETPTEYRSSDGSIRRVTRRRFAHTVEAWQARRRILSTIADNALLGAGAVLLAVLSAVAGGRRGERKSGAVMEPILGGHRLSSHRGPGIVEVLTRKEGRTRIAVLVAPAEFDRLAGTLGRSGNTPLLPASGADRNATNDQPTRWRTEAAADQEPDAESSGPANAPKPDPDGVGRLPEQSAAPSRKRASGRDGGSVGQVRPRRPEPDDDSDWF